jgi:deazaflavin-dependent oxidoreductase (nitroreductase family)
MGTGIKSVLQEVHDGDGADECVISEQSRFVQTHGSGNDLPYHRPGAMTIGPRYVDGRYVAERRRNPLVQTHLGGRILSASQLPFFKLRPPRGFGVLTTTGRRSGRKRSRCVRAIRRGDRAFLVAIGGEYSGWLMNARANPDLRLRLRGGTWDGIARELRDESEREEAMAAYCNTVNPFDYLECRAHRVGRPTREKIDELHRTWFEGGAPLVIELRDQR